MPFNSPPMIQDLRADFEKVLMMVTSPEAATATLDQMQRSLAMGDNASRHRSRVSGIVGALVLVRIANLVCIRRDDFS